MADGSYEEEGGESITSPPSPSSPLGSTGKYPRDGDGVAPGNDGGAPATQTAERSGGRSSPLSGGARSGNGSPAAAGIQPQPGNSGSEQAPLTETLQKRYHSDEVLREKKPSTLSPLAPEATDDMPPVEIAIETTSRFGARFIFTSWYLVLLFALVLQAIAVAQWECANICGGECSFRTFESWNSQGCAALANASDVAPNNYFQAEAMSLAAGQQDVVWRGSFSAVFDTYLNRFVHFVFSMPAPAPFPSTSGSITHTLQFEVQIENVTFLPNGPQRHRQTVAPFTASLYCKVTNPYCDPIVIDTEATNIRNGSTLILSLRQVPDELLNASLAASVGSVYQRAGYTQASLIVRYVMLFISICVTTRFLFSLLTNQTAGKAWLYEQTWVLILEAGLFWYLNPLEALCVYSKPEVDILKFIEFRFPLYYLAGFIAFMFALIASCMMWQRHDSHHPPWGAKLCCALFVLLVMVFDIADVGVHDWNWGMEHCPNLDCGVLGYLFYGTMIAGFLVCAAWLWWLRSNLGHRPYLSCRPQQLALRLFIFLFLTYVLYLALTGAVLLIFYRGISNLIIFQTSTQIGPMVVAFVFVTIMAYAYTSMNRKRDIRRVPLHASNPRWKRVVWPTKWFEWLALHGGSTYIFFSEDEEERFWNIQEKFNKDPRYYDSEEYDPTAESAEDVEGAHNGLRHRSASTILDRESSWRPSQLLTAPGMLLTAVENRIFDTAVHAFHLARRKPFFCLQTAIDCHNLSYQAYGVPESEGDVQVMTGLNVNIPGWCCCLKKDEEESAESIGASMLSPTSNNELETSDMSLSEPSRGRTTSQSPLGAASPTSRKPSAAQSFQGSSAVVINVEQYGYYQLAVVEALAVQVVISELITTLEANRNRTPRLVIAFRGTDNIANAVLDLQLKRVTWPEMDCSMWREKTMQQPAVQRGFLEPWNALRDPILENVLSLIQTRPEHRIYCTGHSLGGALASLCAYTLQKRLTAIGHEYPVPVVYTYGTPRIGNSAFAAEYEKKVPQSFRIVNESDAVSFLSIHGGDHVGMEVIIDRHGNFLCEPMYIEQKFRPIKGKGSSIANHTLTCYGDSLNAVAGNSKLGICKVRCLRPYFPQDLTEELRAKRRASVMVAHPTPTYLAAEATMVLV